LMVSNHYSFAYTHEYAWVLMTLFIFAGALIRQYFVLMHAGKIQPIYSIAGVALILIAFWVAMPAQSSSQIGAQAAEKGPDITEIGAVIEQRCVACHSQTPTQPGFSAPPAGFAYDEIEQIIKQQESIKRVVASSYMPLGNMTNMTEEERALIEEWEE